MSDASQFQAVLSAIAGLGEQIGNLDSGIEQGRAELIKTRLEIMARIDRLQDSVTTMHDDIWVAFTRSERVEKKVASDLDRSREVLRSHSEQLRSLSEELGGVQRQIHHLQEAVRRLRGDS